jgi:hypothetical protein
MIGLVESINREFEYCQWARQRFKQRAIAAVIERMATDGWHAEDEPQFGFLFVRRTGELFMLTSQRSARHPGRSPKMGGSVVWRVVNARVGHPVGSNRGSALCSTAKIALVATASGTRRKPHPCSGPPWQRLCSPEPVRAAQPTFVSVVRSSRRAYGDLCHNARRCKPHTTKGN